MELNSAMVQLVNYVKSVYQREHIEEPPHHLVTPFLTVSNAGVLNGTVVRQGLEDDFVIQYMTFNHVSLLIFSVRVLPIGILISRLIRWCF
jgi:hypothetical protein